MQTLHFDQTYRSSPEQVFAYFSEHENLNTVFAPMKVERLRDGDSERNGVGSVRRFHLKGLLPFEETVTGVVPNERIEYRVSKGTPLKSHFGVMRFLPADGGGTRLDYTVTIGALPGVEQAIGAILRKAIGDGLKRSATEI